MPEYTVIKPCIIQRQPKKEGDRVQMTEREATFLLTGGLLANVENTETKPAPRKPKNEATA